jgi:cell division protein FtsZ
MNRREFLKVLALGGSATAAMPASAILNSVSLDHWPLIASTSPKRFLATGETSETDFPKIGIVAAGGGACGMLRNLQGNLPYLERSVAIYTSPFVLHRTKADRSVRVGQSADKITDSKLLRVQAKAAQSEIRDALAGLDLIWLLSSLGGNAGTGIAPIVADAAKDLGIPVIAASVTPFEFEGERRNQIARAGLNSITRRVAVSIELPNEAYITDDDDETLDTVLGRVSSDFERLYHASSSILSQQGLIGVDFEDFRAALVQGEGLVGFGNGEGNGEDGLRTAFSAVTAHNSLGAERLRQAKGVFVAIHLKSSNEPMRRINEVMQDMNALVSDSEALVIYGAVIDPNLPSDAHISIMAAL